MDLRICGHSEDYSDIKRVAMNIKRILNQLKLKTVKSETRRLYLKLGGDWFTECKAKTKTSSFQTIFTVSTALLAFSILAAIVSPASSKDEITNLHKANLQAHLPDAKHFHEIFAINLDAEFSRKLKSKVLVKYQLLDTQVFQTGVSFPKIYCWVQVFSNKEMLAEGAAKLAAVEKKFFILKTFLSVKEIKSDEKVVYERFPCAVASKILKIAESKESLKIKSK